MRWFEEDSHLKFQAQCGHFLELFTLTKYQAISADQLR